MNKSEFNVTSVGEAPAAERNQRMRKYVITMAVRMACILAMPFAHGWWILVFGLGAIFLPYFAVVVANVKHQNPDENQVEDVTLELSGVEPQEDEQPASMLLDSSAIRVTRIEKFE